MNETAFDKDQRMLAYAMEIIAAAVDSRVANATLTNSSWAERKAKDAARRRFRTIASGNALSLAYYVLADEGGNFEEDVRAAIEAKREPRAIVTEDGGIRAESSSEAFFRVRDEIAAKKAATAADERGGE